MVADTIAKTTHEQQRACLFLKSTLLLGLTLLASCSQDDRTSTITCDRDPEGPISVTTELNINGRRASVTGYLNSWGLSLGSIVRINARSTQFDAAVELQRLQTSKNDLFISPTALQSVALLRGFEAHLDEDLKTMSQKMGIDLDEIILKNTILVFDGSNVQLLPDVAGLLNRDPEVVERIRYNRDTPLAIVSGTIYSNNGLNIFNTYHNIGANTFELGRSYVHVSYSCQLLKKIRHVAYKSARGEPVIIYLTPIRYDGSTARVTIDPAQ